jgi:hypothetical protein
VFLLFHEHTGFAHFFHEVSFADARCHCIENAQHCCASQNILDPDHHQQEQKKKEKKK